jgi:hypothetical protein
MIEWKSKISKKLNPTTPNGVVQGKGGEVEKWEKTFIAQS